MKIEFIGHSGESNQKSVLDLINKSLTDESFDTLIVCSAFTKMSGINLIKNNLLENKNRFQSMNFILGLVPNGTSTEALSFFLENEIKCETFVDDRYMFHPKIYYFSGENYSRFILGSSNLTKSGMIRNVEASIIVDFKTGDSSGKKFIRQFDKFFFNILDNENDNIFPLTKKHLASYIEDGLITSEKGIFDKGEYSKNEKYVLRRSKKNIRQKLDVKIKPIASKFKDTNSRVREFKITNEYLSDWENYFNQYQEYITKKKTVVVKRDVRNSGLYRWYRKQKYFFKKQTIPKEHFERLEKLNFPFEAAHKINHDKAWEKRFEEYKKFIKKYGRTWIRRRRDKSHPLKKLGDWVGIQRSDRNIGKLSQDRIDKLDSVNFPWIPPKINRESKDEAWLERYFELEQYKNQYGHANVPQRNKDGSANSLGKWVNDQRSLKKNGRVIKNSSKRESMSQEREELLNDLGFEWDYELNKHKRFFESKIEQFNKFRFLFPDLKAPRGQFKVERNWLAQMRYNFEKLPKWKQERLLEEKIIKKKTLPNNG